MRVIIAGSRDITDWAEVAKAIEEAPFKVTEVVSGGARGVDYLGEALAALHGMPVKLFPADWRKHGKSAGPKRNREMALYADALIAVWDGLSPGTYNMIETMRKLNKLVHIRYVTETKE